MASSIPGCLGEYDFDHIAYFARKRFIEGYDTISLLNQARTEREKEEIALVAMLDLDDDIVRDLKLCCRYSAICKVTICRDKLKKMIEADMANTEVSNVQDLTDTNTSP